MSLERDIQKIENALKRRAKKEEKEDIVIRELVAYQRNDKLPHVVPLGEFKSSVVTSANFDAKSVETETEEEVMDRMVKYIYELSEWGVKIHAQDNFVNSENYISPQELHALKAAKISNDLPVEMDPNKKHHITRIALNEFALYPHEKRGPLSLEGFHHLMKKIEILAREYPDNFHLVLATIPVKINEDDVKNIGIYIECGAHPSFHPFTKTVVSKIDPIYPNTKTLEYVAGNDHLKDSIPDVISLHGLGLSIQQSGNFVCKTAGGKKFRVGVDTCLENQFKTVKRLVNQQLDSTSRTALSLEPILASHLLPANTADIEPESGITDTIVHIDPKYSAQRGALRQESSVEKPIDTHHITNPAFGSHTVIDQYAQRILEPHTGKLHKKISDLNQFSMRLLALHIYRDQHLAKIDLVSKEINTHILKPLIELLAKLKMISEEESLKELITQNLDRENIKLFLQQLSNENSNNSNLIHLISNTLHLLMIEETEMLFIKEQLLLATFNDNTILHTNTTQTLERSEQDVNNFTFHLPVIEQKEIGTPTQLLSKTAHSNLTAFDDTQNLEFNNSGSTFGKPLTFLENLVVVQYITYFSMFTLPWNKVQQITAEDFTLLHSNLNTLDNLEKQIQNIKDTRSVDEGDCAEILNVLKHTRIDVNNMLSTHTKTNANFIQIQKRISRIQDMVSSMNDPEKSFTQQKN